MMRIMLPQQPQWPQPPVPLQWASVQICSDFFWVFAFPCVQIFHHFSFVIMFNMWRTFSSSLSAVLCFYVTNLQNFLSPQFLYYFCPPHTVPCKIKILASFASIGMIYVLIWKCKIFLPMFSGIRACTSLKESDKKKSLQILSKHDSSYVMWSTS
jgi:hypothetical protein